MPSRRDWQLKNMGGIKSAALATGTFDPPTRGVHCNIAGTITGKLEEDAADGDYVVNAGTTYPFHFKSITTLTDATGRVLY